MHLSLPKNFDTGIIQEERNTNKDEKQQGEQTLQLTFSKENEKGEEEQSEALPSPAKQDEKHELTTLVSHKLVAQGQAPMSDSHGEAITSSSNLGVPSNKEQMMLQLANTFTVSLNISRPISIILNSDIIHLFLVQNAHTIVVTKDISHKLVPPDKNLLLNLAQSKEASPPMVNKTEAIKWVKATKQRSHAPDQRRAVIISYLLKGEPPDVH